MTLAFFTYLFAILWIIHLHKLRRVERMNEYLNKELDKMHNAYDELNLKYRRDRIER